MTSRPWGGKFLGTVSHNFSRRMAMTGYMINGNHHGGIHWGKEIVSIFPANAKVEIRNRDNVRIHADSVTLEDGTCLTGPVIHVFIEGPGCT